MSYYPKACPSCLGTLDHLKRLYKLNQLPLSNLEMQSLGFRPNSYANGVSKKIYPVVRQ